MIEQYKVSKDTLSQINLTFYSLKSLLKVIFEKSAIKGRKGIGRGQKSAIQVEWPLKCW